MLPNCLHGHPGSGEAVYTGTSPPLPVTPASVRDTTRWLRYTSPTFSYRAFSIGGVQFLTLR